MKVTSLLETTPAWLELASRRFPELPGDCGNSVDPGIIDTADFRDWSRAGTTPDQLRIERYVDRYDLRTSRILQIGIGASGLASRFHRRVRQIVGTTIDNPEIRRAAELRVPNYDAVLRNKYAAPVRLQEERFDFIIDNNPTSSCCCMKHLARLFSFYDANLSRDGQVVTDRIGLGWVPQVPAGNPRWRFDFDDIAAVGRTVGLEAFRINRFVYVLSRSPPRRPVLLWRVLSMVRWTAWGASALYQRAVRRLKRALAARVSG
jgi:hypothetical protein